MKTIYEHIINELKLSNVSTGNKLNRRKLKDLKKGDTFYIVDFDRKKIEHRPLENDIERNGPYFRFKIKCKDGYQCFSINDPDFYIYYYYEKDSVKAMVSDLDALYEKKPQSKTFKLK